MQPRVLNTLPVVSIDVEFPDLEKNDVLWPVNSPWQNAEKEGVLGIIVTAAVRKGNWHPVPAQTFDDLLKESPWRLFSENVNNAVWAMVEEGLIEIIRVQDADYLVPTLGLAQALAQCDLRAAPAIRT